jgi:hypothetical protein
MMETKLKVRSLHSAFAPVGSIREVTGEEAKLLALIGRAELLRGDAYSSGIPARVIEPVTRAQIHYKRRAR